MNYRGKTCMSTLEIKNLHVNVGGQEIIRGFNLTINQGEVHALMGPNGAGKSTLSNTIMGHPKNEIIEGQILLDGEDITTLAVDERSHKGIFLAFQYPVSIPGVTMANFLRVAVNAKLKAHDPDSKGISLVEFRKKMKAKMDMLKMDYSFGGRYLNEGFSGGEKKRAEVLQLAMLEPKFAILDETDSGLDIDAIRIVSDGVNSLASENLGILVITHYQRLLNYIKPDFVHILFDGRIVETGGPELALKLEEHGYDWVRDEFDKSDDVENQA
jgi:Fe-S cluster assembly ATP-binding protein